MIPAQLRHASVEQLYLYEERAAIIEYCGNVPRAIAERAALKEVFRYPNGCPILTEGPQRDDL